ncbi:hypothetical protein QFZ34_004410 [Phyllobacterium ifriqiyense]|uniref:Uncharacterized protein n=2 Tax=Phyllobacterium ifriqiyense TaxID=314238 RepID=A0ABU0SEN7_9HYPH|nr:hypothetical protein [Phyllobacterium ifriqiyense]MDQ0999228.1 hypothetical protein [Phyllobacterium ifriqiyense]
MNIGPLFCRVWDAGFGLIEGSRPYSIGKQLRKDARTWFRANSWIASQRHACFLMPKGRRNAFNGAKSFSSSQNKIFGVLCKKNASYYGAIKARIENGRN